MRIRINEVRQELGISQSELAERAGLSRPYLAQLESGARQLNAARQSEIAAALGVDANDLVDFSAPGKEQEEKILSAFRKLSRAQQDQWLNWADVILAQEDA